MAIRDVFKVSRKTFFNPAAWIDADALETENRLLWGYLKGLTKPQEAERKETFEEAMKRQGLSEQDLKDGIGTYRALALIFMVFGVLLLMYGFYLIVKHYSFAGFMLAAGASGLCFSQTFKYDFWALQMQKRQLGLKLSDWMRHYLG